MKFNLKIVGFSYNFDIIFFVSGGVDIKSVKKSLASEDLVSPSLV